MSYDYFPGTIELLKELQQQDIACGVVTSSDRHKMEALYKQHPEFPSYFKAIVTGEMVKEPKPSPDCFLLGAKLLGIDIGNCCVVEDSLNGLRAGMSSGARVLGVATTCSRDIIAQHCHSVVDDISQVRVTTLLEL